MRQKGQKFYLRKQLHPPPSPVITGGSKSTFSKPSSGESRSGGKTFAESRRGFGGQGLPGRHHRVLVTANVIETDIKQMKLGKPPLAWGRSLQRFRGFLRLKSDMICGDIAG